MAYMYWLIARAQDTTHHVPSAAAKNDGAEEEDA